MKIRNGFISNSSSASFIIGVCLFDTHDLKHAKQLSGTIIDLNNIPEDYWDYKLIGNSIEVEAFDYTAIYQQYLNESGEIVKPYALVLNECGREPEYDERTYEYNYDDIDFTEEWFSKKQLDTIDFIQDHNGDYNCGGGRDG